MSDDKAASIVLITGGNRGIGFETAMQLAERGFYVFIGARNEAQGREAAEKIQAGGGKATSLLLDVSRSESVHQAVGQFRKIADHLDVLINNAGIYPDEGVNILTIPREQMVNTLETNTFGPLEVTQAFVPYLRTAVAARVINVSSGYGELGGLTANVPS
jgi:NAD(P)-dependent dehydrogenase (short-subunit alcohol dehydrogenase family)